jgi:hypothetical protein
MLRLFNELFRQHSIRIVALLEMMNDRRFRKKKSSNIKSSLVFVLLASKPTLFPFRSCISQLPTLYILGSLYKSYSFVKRISSQPKL